MERSNEEIDTNILVRMVLGDRPDIENDLQKLLEREGVEYYVDDMAISELVYVLEKNYKFSRAMLADEIDILMEANSNFLVNKIVKKVLAIYVTHPKLSFNDCYLVARTEERGNYPLWTLDHKLATQCEVAKELGR
ncbi:PIN domain-containing protein [Candidatus Saccharibacteria bacterium]|nr:PIN domain-containing protein [Candidatus Saccharibacteria bacterium]